MEAISRIERLESMIDRIDAKANHMEKKIRDLELKNIMLEVKIAESETNNVKRTEKIEEVIKEYTTKVIFDEKEGTVTRISKCNFKMTGRTASNPPSSSEIPKSPSSSETPNQA